MKEKWRMLLTENNSAYTNMAIDRAVMITNKEKKVPPTVRFYTWAPPAISIGYFQSLEEEIDLTICKKLGIDYVRRITGGGAVFHDKELTYSIVIPESRPEIPKKIIDSYGRICGAIIKGLSNLGIESQYAPINDIISNGKKISGNAQTRKERTVLQHGTVLMDVDVDKMFSVLKVPNEKIKDKLIKDVKQRVTSVKNILNEDITFLKAADAMKLGFENEFDIELVKEKLTDEEIKLTEKFEKQIFSSKDWNHKR